MYDQSYVHKKYLKRELVVLRRWLLASDFVPVLSEKPFGWVALCVVWLGVFCGNFRLLWCLIDNCFRLACARGLLPLSYVVLWSKGKLASFCFSSKEIVQVCAGFLLSFLLLFLRLRSCRSFPQDRSFSSERQGVDDLACIPNPLDHDFLNMSSRTSTPP